MRRYTSLAFAVLAICFISACSSDFTTMLEAKPISADTSTVSADSGPAPCEIKKWHPDSDGDGKGSMDPKLTVDACTAPTTPIVYLADASDCNDAAKSVHPDAPEICNKVDDDCDGSTDDSATMDWWVDSDSDGYGNPKLKHTGACTGVENWLVANADDCNDGDKKINPGMKETCETPGVDDNCSGQADEGVMSTFHSDVDGDGRGDPKKPPVFACAPSKEAVISNDDCDDADAKNFPGNPEVCDGQDNDCDGKVDNGLDKIYFKDKDKDGYGAKDDTVVACKLPDGATMDSSDCNDDPKTGAAVHPGAIETCNHIDDNCNGQIDDGDGVQFSSFVDADGDSYGSQIVKFIGCKTDQGFIGSSDDCDDADLNVHPGAKELCDGKVNNCSVDKLDEPDSLCDDGDKFTVDGCHGIKKCGYTDVNMVFDCQYPEKFSWEKGYQCQAAVFFQSAEGIFNGMNFDAKLLPAKATCMALKAKGSKLHVEDGVSLVGDSSVQWVGGKFVDVSDSLNKTMIEGTPGNVTMLTPGPDFPGVDSDYVCSDFAICDGICDK